MHLFMITSWNKIGINIGDLFLFLEFDPEGEKWPYSDDQAPPELIMPWCSYLCVHILMIRHHNNMT